MESALIISKTRQTAQSCARLLGECGVLQTELLSGAGEARRLLLDRDFDLCVINAPLSDEFGDRLARDVSQNTFSQVIVLAAAESAERVTEQLGEYGVFVLSKPVQRADFTGAVRFANASYRKLCAMRTAQQRLMEKLEDIRVIGRAKCALMQYLKLTETQAHKYIERQAMDTRQSKRVVAQNIIKTYES